MNRKNLKNLHWVRSACTWSRKVNLELVLCGNPLASSLELLITHFDAPTPSSTTSWSQTILGFPSKQISSFPWNTTLKKTVVPKSIYAGCLFVCLLWLPRHIMIIFLNVYPESRHRRVPSVIFIAWRAWRMPNCRGQELRRTQSRRLLGSSWFNWVTWKIC